MNSNLVATFGDDSFESIARLTGAYSSGTSLPLVKMNRHSEDEQGNAIPVGSYSVGQDGSTVYSKIAKFRVFLNTYQYMVYDSVTNKFTNKSIIIKSFNEQAIDEKGGIRCGKISAKELLTLADKGLISDSDKVSQRAIKCYRGLYGLLTLEDAVTETGVKAVVADLPVLWRMSGDSFSSPKEALDSITKMRHLCFQHWLLLDKPERKKQGTNIYYVPSITVDLAKVVEFTNDDMATFTSFQQLIDQENAAVADKWRASKKINVVDDISVSLADLDLNDSVEDL